MPYIKRSYWFILKLPGDYFRRLTLTFVVAACHGVRRANSARVGPVKINMQKGARHDKHRCRVGGGNGTV